MSFSPGEVLAEKYRIVRMIGRGGVGEVYEGENLRIRRKVAIKTLRSEFLAKSDVVQRFEREAQAAGRIGSAHIVEVLDLGDLPDGSRFLVMEFLEGLTLSKHIKGAGRLGAIETAQILMQLLEGLGAAHAAGIIHRDLKPANVVLTTKAGDHFAKILDFGVSKFNTLASDELAMTKTGMVVGTPYYMAPEQAKGARDLDHRVDLYAAGVILYEAVTGEVPFNADTFNELLFKIVLEAAKPVESVVANIDPNFAAIVNKSMAREPSQRFQTAKEFQQALEQWAAGAGPQFAAALNASVQASSGAPAQHQPPPTGQYAAGGTGAYAAVGTGQYAAVGAGPPTAVSPGHQLGTGTAGNWANTGGYAAAEPAPKKSNTGLFIGIAAAAVLLIGGGTVVAMSFSHGKEDAAAAAGKLEAERGEAEKARGEAEKAAQDAVAKAAAETDKAKAENQALKGEAEKAKTAADAVAKAVAAAPAPAPRAGGRPASAVAKPEPKPEPKPSAVAPAPAAAPASTGRRIRTTL